MRTAQQQTWVEEHAIQPQWLDLARRALAEIQDGEPVMDALRRYPLPDGGYLGKYVLVETYHQMVRSG